MGRKLSRIDPGDDFLLIPGASTLIAAPLILIFKSGRNPTVQ